MDDLAKYYDNLHDLAKPTRCYVRSECLLMRQSTLGDRHPHALGQMNDMALLYLHGLGRCDVAAEPLSLGGADPSV